MVFSKQGFTDMGAIKGMFMGEGNLPIKLTLLPYHFSQFFISFFIHVLGGF